MLLDTTPFGGAIALGPRDLPSHHLAMVMALQGAGVQLTLAGTSDHAFGDWHRRNQGGSDLRIVPESTNATAAITTLARSAALDGPPSPPQRLHTFSLSRSV